MTKQEILASLEQLILETDLDDFSQAQKPVTDTRKINQDDIFICIEGYQMDGHDFAAEAMRKGAALLITQRFLDINLPQIVVADSRKATALLARKYYNDPSSQLKLIGVTGTNGKTTITHLCFQLLQEMGKKVGLIGTLGYQIGSALFPTERTTPDILDLNNILQQMVEADIEYVVMEVSSHALALSRVDYLSFTAAVFSNLTQDHLDFHADIEDYAATKFRLFELLKQNNGVALINLDDEYGRRLAKKEHYKMLGISFQEADITIKNCRSDFQGSRFSLLKDKQYEHYKTKLSGT